MLLLIKKKLLIHAACKREFMYFDSIMLCILDMCVCVCVVKVSNLSVFNYCDTLSPMCFTNMYIVFFKHPGYIYMAFRGLQDADPLDPSVLLLQDRHRSHIIDTKQVCILLFMNSHSSFTL